MDIYSRKQSAPDQNSTIDGSISAADNSVTMICGIALGRIWMACA
ncbi:hypothetical protein [Rhizobium sp. BR 362]